MKVFFLLLFFVSGTLVSQKLVRKTIVDSSIKRILVDTDNCFDLKVETADSNELKVEALIEGEYKNDLTLNFEHVGQSIFIGVGFTPNFRKPNDKLGAHKVVSIALNIFMPKNQNVEINGTNCNVKAAGTYDSMKINLNDGNCLLNDVSEKATVRTQSGNIEILSDRATIRAASKYGKVVRDKIPNGENSFDLTSTTGDITIVFHERPTNN